MNPITDTLDETQTKAIIVMPDQLRNLDEKAFNDLWEKVLLGDKAASWLWGKYVRAEEAKSYLQAKQEELFERLELEKEKNNPHAYNLEALMRSHGIGKEFSSVEEQDALYIKATLLGSPYALGNLYSIRSSSPEFMELLKDYTHNSDQRIQAQANFYLALIYWDNEKDINIAKSYLNKATSLEAQDNIDAPSQAYYHLGLLYSPETKSGEDDPIKAEAYFKEGVRLENPNCYLRLGEKSLKDKDNEQALAYFLEASKFEVSHPGVAGEAYACMGYYYEKNEVNKLIDYKQALYYYKKATQFRNKFAYFRMAQVYFLKQPKDLIKAQRYASQYLKLVNEKEEVAAAYYLLASIYKQRSAVELNVLITDYKSAAMLGFDDAYFQLGKIYEDTPELDKALAIEYYNKAIDSSSVTEKHKAQVYYRLGMLRLSPSGNHLDPIQAFVHIRKAAELGHIPAYLMLATSYEFGILASSIPVDFEEAIKYHMLIITSPGAEEDHPCETLEAYKSLIKIYEREVVRIPVSAEVLNSYRTKVEELEKTVLSLDRDILINRLQLTLREFAKEANTYIDTNPKENPIDDKKTLKIFIKEGMNYLQEKRKLTITDRKEFESQLKTELKEIALKYYSASKFQKMFVFFLNAVLVGLIVPALLLKLSTGRFTLPHPHGLNHQYRLFKTTMAKALEERPPKKAATLRPS